MKKNMIKKFTLGIASVCALGLILCGCGKKSSDNSVQEVKDNKTLTIGTSADYAPFEFPIVKNGKKEITGYDIMLAQKVADKLGVKLKIVNTEFPSLISELKNDKVDLVLSGMTKTAKREKVVDFSKPYYTVENVMLVQKKDADKYNKISDTKGKQIGAQQSTTQEDIIKKQMKGANLVTESVTTSLATELKNGKIDGLVLENAIANNYVKQNPGKYAIAKVKLTTGKDIESYSVATKKGDKKLIKVVNKVIDKIQKDGTSGQMLQDAQNLQAKYGK